MATYFRGDDNEKGSVYDDPFKSEREQLGVGGKKSRSAKKAERDDPLNPKPESTLSVHASNFKAGVDKLKEVGASNKAESEEKKGLYKRSVATAKAGFSGKKKGDKKKKALLAVGAAGLPTIAVILILYGLLGFSIEHISKLHTAYRFGQFHRHMATITRQVALSDIATTPGSKTPPNAAFTGGSLYSRMRGWSPAKAFSSLGTSDLRITYGSGLTPGSRQIIAIEKLDGERVVERTDRNGTIDTEFDSKLRSTIDASLTEQGRSKFFRRKTINHLRSTGGLKLTRFKGFIDLRNGPPPTAEEGRILGYNEDLDIAKGDSGQLRSGLPSVEDDAKANLEASRKSGRPVRGIPRSRLASLSLTDVTTKVSDAVFIATIYCIFRDIANQAEEVIENRVNGFMSLSQATLTASDQFRAGDSTQAALRYESKKWENFEESQANIMARGESLDAVKPENRLQLTDFPIKVYGFDLEDVNLIVSTVNTGFIDDIPLAGPAINRAIDEGCQFALNPITQGVVSAAEIGVFIATLGSSRLTTAAVTRVVGKTALKAVGMSLSLGFIIDLTSSMIDTINAVSFTVGEGEGANGTNKFDAGLVLMKTGAAAPYSGSIDAEVASQQARQGVLDLKENERSKGALYAYFSPSSPFSLTSSLLMGAPVSFTGFTGFLGDRFSSLFNTQNSFNYLFTDVSAAAKYDPFDEFYGMEDRQYGFVNSQVNGADPDFRFDNVIARVEPQIEEFKAQYGECLTVTATEVALGQVPNKCNEKEGRIYKKYFAFCDTIAAVSLEGSAQDSYATEDCLDLAGPSRDKFKLSSGSSSSNTGPGGGIADIGGGLNVTGPIYPCQGNGLEPEQNAAEGNNWGNIVPTGDIGNKDDGTPINVYIREACNTTNQKTVVLVSSIHGSENAGQRVSHELLFREDNVPDNVRIIAIPELCTCSNTGSRALNNEVNGRATDLNRNFDYNWGSLPAVGSVGIGYSKGSAPNSAKEAAAFVGFANSIANEIDLLAVFHSGIHYVASAGSTPVSIASAYANASSGAVPLRGSKNGKVYQSGSLDGWINEKHGVNALLVEMGSDSVDTSNIPGHVQGVISAINSI